MTDEQVRNLWGHDFRVVAEGLAEADVVAFVERLMAQYQEDMKRLDHVTSLQELAKSALKQAEAMALTITEEAKREAEMLSTKIIADAMNQAREVIDKANLQAKAQAEKLVREMAQLAIDNIVKEVETGDVPDQSPVPDPGGVQPTR